VVGDSIGMTGGMNLKIFPNPFEATLNVELMNAERQECVIEILNTTGQVVLYQKGILGNTNYLLNVSDLNRGVYILKITADSMVEFIRIIKQ
jgi:hypothetical protein